MKKYSKKLLCIVLSLLFAALSVSLCAASADVGVVSVKLNSDIAGKTSADVDSLIELKSGSVVLHAIHGEPVSASDYAGTPYYDAFVAGRTYYISYCLCPADGYELPDELTDENLMIECGKNVTVYSKAITESHTRNENGGFDVEKALRIQASVLVDGNVFQRIIGWINDLILKIRAWSLY